MSRIEFERDRTPPGAGYGEGIIWDRGELNNVSITKSVAEGDEVQASGQVVTDYNPISLGWPRPARVILDAAGDRSTFNVGKIGKNDTKSWSASALPTASAGQPITVEIEFEIEKAGGVWESVDSQTYTVQVKSEEEVQTEETLRYLPWVLGGSGAAALYSNQKYGRTRSSIALAGGAAGVVGKTYADTVGVDVPVPDLPTRELVVIGGVLAAGGFLLSQGSNYIPGVE